MTEGQINTKLELLRGILQIYKSIYHDSGSVCYHDRFIQQLMYKTQEELVRLEEVLFNGEAKDSFLLYGASNE